jgi:hypothetical protein
MDTPNLDQPSPVDHSVTIHLRVECISEQADHHSIYDQAQETENFLQHEMLTLIQSFFPGLIIIHHFAVEPRSK